MIIDKLELSLKDIINLNHSSVAPIKLRNKTCKHRKSKSITNDRDMKIKAIVALKRLESKIKNCNEQDKQSSSNGINSVFLQIKTHQVNKLTKQLIIKRKEADFITLKHQSQK
jgi:hypothetical protein